MNKNQSITLILGFVLIVLTWVWGNSQFQGFIGVSGFGGISGERKAVAVIEKRIKPKILVFTLLTEVVGTGILVFLLKDPKSKK